MDTPELGTDQQGNGHGRKKRPGLFTMFSMTLVLLFGFLGVFFFALMLLGQVSMREVTEFCLEGKNIGVIHLILGAAVPLSALCFCGCFAFRE